MWNFSGEFRWVSKGWSFGRKTYQLGNMPAASPNSVLDFVPHFLVRSSSKIQIPSPASLLKPSYNEYY